MAKNKWIYDASTGTYHNVEHFMQLSVDEITLQSGEVHYEIEGLRIDGKFVQVSDRVTNPQILHDVIAMAVGCIQVGEFRDG